MNYDIMTVLQEKSPEFSKGQKKIARYIMDAYDKAAFMTANKLGRTVGVSESTVVRFAVDLGFDGYPSMQKAMQEMVLNRLTSVQRIEVASDRFGDQDVISMVIHADIEKLRQTGDTAKILVQGAAFRTCAEMLFEGIAPVAPQNHVGCFSAVHDTSSALLSDQPERAARSLFSA